MKKQFAAVIYTDHALSAQTVREFEYMEVNEDQTQVRRNKNLKVPYVDDVMITYAVDRLARAGKITDKGIWLIEITVGLKLRMKAIMLETEI